MIRTSSSLNPSQILSDTEDSGGLGTFDNIVRQAYKQYFNGQRKRERPLKRWSDQMISVTRVLLLTAERHVVNRTEWRGATSRKTASGQYGLCYKSCEKCLYLLDTSLQVLHEQFSQVMQSLQLFRLKQATHG